MKVKREMRIKQENIGNSNRYRAYYFEEISFLIVLYKKKHIKISNIKNDDKNYWSINNDVNTNTRNN